MTRPIDWRSYFDAGEYIWNWNNVTMWLYYLNWNSNDSSWNNNNWTNTNITRNSNGILQYATLNWSSSFITFNDTDKLDWMQNITLWSWIKPTTITDSYFFTKDDVTNRSWTFDVTNYSWHLAQLDALFFVWGSYSYAYPTSQNIITAWVWQHVWVTRNSAGIIKFYLNWYPLATTQPNTAAGTINNSSAPVILGKRNYVPSPWHFNWDIWESFIDAQARSDQKFKDYYEYTKWRYWLL